MFKTISQSLHARLAQITKASDVKLFVVDVQKDEVWQAYLAGWPEAERQEHNCNLCRQFINNYGAIVAVDKNNNINTLWDFELNAPYDNITKNMHALVSSRKIAAPFLTSVPIIGTEKSRQRMPDGTIHTWNHFHAKLDNRFVTRITVSPEAYIGNQRTTKEVFERGLQTIDLVSIDAVLELINANQLYRGQEFKESITQFRKHLVKYKTLDPQQKEAFLWVNAEIGGRIRNTAIGTLLVDVSEGKDLEYAVAAFERMVAPANYKRPSAVVTPRMVEDAKKTLEELGYMDSIHRRHANSRDISIENTIFTHRKRAGVDDVFSAVAETTTYTEKQLQAAKKLSLPDFISNVVPTAASVKMLLTNNHNFVSLIAPEHADSKNMFAWSNPFSWTYHNNLTDVLKEKVKKAGGKVDGVLRASLEWFNHDDLDIHMIEPNGNEIYFGNRISRISGGNLDVDMNAGGGTTRTPVENIIFPDEHRMLEGTYKVVVHQFRQREADNIGFNVQIECGGVKYDFSFTKKVSGNVHVADVIYKKSTGFTVIPKIKSSSAAVEKNGCLTGKLHDVTMMLYSPNHWQDAIGNKHLFLILDKARSDIPLRGFFNEFLHADLAKHRKVLELVGGKMMVHPSEEEVTGVGFSLTQQHVIHLNVDGKLYAVTI